MCLHFDRLVKRISQIRRATWRRQRVAPVRSAPQKQRSGNQRRIVVDLFFASDTISVPVVFFSYRAPRNQNFSVYFVCYDDTRNTKTIVESKYENARRLLFVRFDVFHECFGELLRYFPKLYAVYRHHLFRRVH